MRRAIFAALLVALLATPCLAAEAEAEPKAETEAKTKDETKAEATPDAATQKALDQIAKLTANVRSFSAEFTTPAPAGAARPPIKGSFTFMLPDSFKMTMTMMPGIQTIMISDGKTMWTQVPALKMVVKVDATKLKKALEEHGMPAQKPQHNIATPLIMIKAGAAKLVGSQKAGDIECWVFEGPPEAAGQVPAAPANVKKVRVLVSKKDGLARRMAYTNADGKALMEARYDNVKTNPKVDASLFQYTPPKGTNVTDRTQQMIMMMKQLVPKKE